MPRIVFVAGLLAWLATVVLLCVPVTPLGHDEAQYAIAARDLLDGAPARWDYVSTGVVVVAVPGSLAGGGELALRIVPVLLALAFALVAARLARDVGGAATAAWTLAVLAATSCIARYAADLLSDLPATGCLLAGIAIVASEILREGGLRWRFVFAAPCFAAAFYLRYGSVLPLAVICGAAVVVGWRALVRRPAIVLAAIALFAVLLVPHLELALRKTGHPLGILRSSRGYLGDAYLGKALVTYVTANPFTFYGVAATPVLLAGLAAIHRWRDRRVRLLWLIAVGDILAVGLMPIGQVRYICLGIVLLLILGVDEIVRVVGRTGAAARPRARRVVGVAAIVVVAASWIVVALTAHVRAGVRLRNMAGTLTAIPAIRADAGGASCRVIGRHTTQLQWYTGCVAVYEVAPEIVARERVYVVYEPGSRYQPDLAVLPGVLRVLVERPGLVTVMRLEPKP